MQKVLVCNKFANEISFKTIKKLYTQNKELFEVAVNAVVRGCVKSYNFDNVAQKYFGIVTSFDGNEMYNVEITLSHRAGIKTTACDCPEDGMCHHIGALALHSGYDEPIFSYATDDSSDLLQPIEKVYAESTKLEPDETITATKIKIKNLANISFDTVKITSEKSVIKEAVPTDLVLVTNVKENTDNENHKSALACDKCDKIFDDKFQFEIHHRYSHKRKIPMFPCAICTSRMHTKQELETHKEIAHQNQHCNKCGLFFLTQASRNEHFRIMHVNKKFCCDKCPRYFLHYKFRCSICCKIFSRVCHFNRHIKEVHEIEPSTKSSVKRIYNYECKICSQTFPTSGMIDKHLRSHTKIFQLNECSQGHKKALTAHKTGHSSHRRLHDGVLNKRSVLQRRCTQKNCDPPENEETETSSE